MPGHRIPPRRRPPLGLVLLVLAVATLAVVGFRLVSDADRAKGDHPVAQRTSNPSAHPTSPSPPAKKKASPSPTRSASGPRGTLVIHGTGDVNVDPSYIPNFRAYGYGYAWSGLNGLFQKDDLTVINLECAVSNLGSKYPGKQFNFRGDPAALPAMKAGGVEVANMGNNHSYDYGPTALVDMRKNLLDNAIQPVGAGTDPAEANKPALFDIKGWKVSVVGFDKVVDPWPTAVAAPGHPGTADGHDLDAMVAAVKAAKAHADLVVVIIHWGVELDTQPRPDDVELGHRFIDAGADVIFGGHSHRLQPMGTYKGKPIFYSLGNFVWPNFSAAGATTAVAEVRISPNGAEQGRLIPAYIESAGHPVLRGT